MIDTGCRQHEAKERGLFFCAAHRSYGYLSTGICHANSGGGSWLVTRAWDGPVTSPFVQRALASLLPAKEITR